jgi:hypothetical protein
VPSLTPPVVEDVWVLLQLRNFQHSTESGPAADPPLTPEVFEAVLACALEGYSFEQLADALRHGQPLARDAGPRLAQEVLLARPPSLGEVLADCSRHERLAGAVAFVDQLVGALTLPPRRLADRQLPLGGYADVGTRGQPEAILPVQFALDELEFLRRHAEHELLYYRREEPHVPTADALVVLLDQGVRTWGRVRLALAGCALALAELAQRKRLPLAFATTGTGGQIVDPLAVEPPWLAEWLGASDLSPQPGLALEKVAETVRGPSDVVLLTQSANLDEPDVRVAAARFGPDTRLFTVAVETSGAVVFHELRHGLPVPLARFHVDLDQRTSGSAGASPSRLAAWHGDTEPVGFPFRFGPGGKHDPLLFAFDQSGDWVLAAFAHHLLLVRHDGSNWEMLPRALVEGRLLSDVHAVLGVTGGFVVTGAVPGQVAAAHYDLESRRVRVHTFAAGSAQLTRGLEFRYLRHRHCLIVRLGEQFAWVPLHTGARDQPVPPELCWRPEPPLATRLAVSLPVQSSDAPGFKGSEWRRSALHFDPRSGALAPDVCPAWPPFTPLADGLPALSGRTLMRAECCRDVLAVLLHTPERGKELWLFQGPTGQTITTLPLPFERDAFTLSPDGRYLAMQRGSCQVEVRETAPGGLVIGSSPVGRHHNNVVVHLGDRWQSITIDRRFHLVEWASGTLIHRYTEDSMNAAWSVAHLRRTLDERTQALPGRVPGFLGYDRVRFRLAAWRNLIAVVTMYGEVFLFEHTGEVVCGFFAFRDDLAAWMPDGTCLGPEALLGQRETPAAAGRIGAALLDAWQRGEGTIT